MALHGTEESEERYSWFKGPPQQTAGQGLQDQVQECDSGLGGLQESL